MSNESEIKRHIAEQKRKADVRAAMQTLIDTTNVMGGDDIVAAGILEGIEASHRTLQQSFMRSFVLAMKEYGETPFKDGRNEAAVSTAKKIGEMETYLPYV